MSVKSELTSKPVSQIKGRYKAPGDKSISHRLVMLGSLAEGVSTFSDFLYAEDCIGTMHAFREMGVGFETDETKGTLKVEGVGLNGLKTPVRALYLGNSGTTIRLLMGILAGQTFETTLTGDSSLVKRPMKRVTGPLRDMGAQITGRDDANFAPLQIRGGNLHGITWKNQIGSAQVKSAILLAGLFAKGETVIEEMTSSRDHTERLFELFGAPFEQKNHFLKVRSAQKLNPVQFQVPGDISSAAFLIAAALIVPHSELIVEHVGLNPTRIGFLDAVQKMGADLKIEYTAKTPEPVGNIIVRSSKLKGISITKQMIPALIDELPILMILCALAEGASLISGAEELRVKETDRIHSMVQGLKAVGGKAKEHEDGCEIEGVDEFSGGSVSSFGDHRTAMSFLIAGLRSPKGVSVKDTACIQTSYPGFEQDLKNVSIP